MVTYPDAYLEANRQALQFRAHLLPYIYNGHRSGACVGAVCGNPLQQPCCLVLSHSFVSFGHTPVCVNGTQLRYVVGHDRLVFLVDDSAVLLLYCTGASLCTSPVP